MSLGRIGVDVGGTFSDLAYVDRHGSLRIGKGLTTPGALEDGVTTLVGSSLRSEEIEQASHFVHATTTALNAVLQRKGAVVGLLATRGYRDVLELRRAERRDFNDPQWQTPPPLVPRQLRLPIPERMLADGTVHLAIDRDAVRKAARVFEENEVECVAVCFLHAYVNSDHELAAEEELRARGFTGDVVLSHRISRELREYERMSTTVIDAYVRPSLGHYLRRLGSSIGGLGFSGELLATTSGGGAMTFQEADERPCETIQSGPVAGAVGAGDVCQRLGIPTAVMIDIGGTSCDTCLVVDGRPATKYEGSVAGMPVQTPWVDVRSIGAGGGSIASMSPVGRMQVGPHSAGARPGPACYQLGGTEPTVTDAAALLGMLGPDQLGGGIELDRAAARLAFEPLAERLGTHVEQAAAGVLRLLCANMANATREVTIDQGHDPREATLFAIGGAGPLFASTLAEELAVDRIVVPNHPGVFSAWGLLSRDLTRTSARTAILPLDESGLTSANAILEELLEDLVSANSGGAPKEEIREAMLDLRYAGQTYSLTLPVRTEGGRITADESEIRTAFLAESGRAYGYSRPAPVEIATVRAILRLSLPRPDERFVDDSADHERDEPTTMDAYSLSADAERSFRIIPRSSVSSETSVSGPAILTEPTTTTYVDVGWRALSHPTGHLLLTSDKAAV